MENSEQKLIKLLKNYPAELAEIVLNASREMSQAKLKELYFVLNSDNKQALQSLLKNNAKDLSENLEAYKNLNKKLQNIGVKLKESKDRDKDRKMADNLIKNYG